MPSENSLLGHDLEPPARGRTDQGVEGTFIHLEFGAPVTESGKAGLQQSRSGGREADGANVRSVKANFEQDMDARFHDEVKPRDKKSKKRNCKIM